MIRLFPIFVFIAVGAIMGSVFFHLFARKKISQPLCIGLGVLGAFAGMLLADLADIHLVGNFVDSLLFSSLGSLALLCLNLVLRRKG